MHSPASDLTPMNYPEKNISQAVILLFKEFKIRKF